eukprot:4422791-Pyramimonas_sp.AAC.1
MSSVAVDSLVLPVPGVPWTTVTWCAAVARRARLASSLRPCLSAPCSRVFCEGLVLALWKTRPTAELTSSSEKAVAAGSEGLR